MAELWRVRVKGGTGKEIYGDDYTDIWAINRLHFAAASEYSCDHVRLFPSAVQYLASNKLYPKKAPRIVSTTAAPQYLQYSTYLCHAVLSSYGLLTILTVYRLSAGYSDGLGLRRFKNYC